MDSFKSQETYFNGVLYRSKNEAKWACFFDRCGIRYFYEPETFITSSGKTYKPDFYLPKYRKYVEVKSSYDSLHNEDMDRKIGEAIDFNETKISNGLIILGSFPFDVRVIEGLCMDAMWLHWRTGVVVGYVSIYDDNKEIALHFHDTVIDVATCAIPKAADPSIKLRQIESSSTKLYEAVKYVNDYQFNKYGG